MVIFSVFCKVSRKIDLAQLKPVDNYDSQIRRNGATLPELPPSGLQVVGAEIKTGKWSVMIHSAPPHNLSPHCRIIQERGVFWHVR